MIEQRTCLLKSASPDNSDIIKVVKLKQKNLPIKRKGLFIDKCVYYLIAFRFAAYMTIKTTAMKVPRIGNSNPKTIGTIIPAIWVNVYI